MLAFLGDGSDQAVADGAGECSVLFLGLVELLLGQAFELGDGGLVVVLSCHTPSVMRIMESAF